MTSAFPTPGDVLLGIADCARELRYSESYIRKLANGGRLQCLRTVGGHRLFRLSDVRAYRRARRRGRNSTRSQLAAA